jgi:GNAT superfamily N-acetyltransferase
MKIRIKNLDKKDIPTCVRIILQTGAGCNTGEIKKIMEYSLVKGIKPLNPNYYLLLLDDKIIGVSGLYYDYEDPADIMWMDYFAVSPKFQRHGYGTKMLKNLEKICATKKIRRLCVFTGNNPAVKFYQKSGFQICGKIKDYYSKNKDRTWLCKNLK